MAGCNDCHACGSVAVAELPRGTTVKAVALIGPPNSGKTTLFNRLTGLRQKVANFPGVTVEQHTGLVEIPGGGHVQVIDLPGVYSLTPRSEDERIAHDVLHGLAPGTAKPEAVLLVLDSTNLGRHLMLAAPILALGLPTLVILNMADDLRNGGGRLDLKALSRQLGAPVALVSARQGEGLEQVTDFLAGAMPKPAPVLLPVLQNVPQCRAWAGQMGNKAHYHAPAPPRWTRRLDAIFLHPIAGPLIFLAVVVLVFQTIFAIADPSQKAVDWVLAKIAGGVGMVLPASLFRSLLIDGVLKGVGSVVVFLPQILMLFLFIGILEDSGYLARAALIADRTMARVGLQGKSFIPLLSAHACAVPAIMSTRTIENQRDRFATILIAPLTTCSARFQVYSLFIAAFLPNRHLLGAFLSQRTAAMIGLYALGFVAAVATAKLFEVVDSEERPHAVHAGDAVLPLAHGAVAGAAAVRSRQDLHVPRGHHHSAGQCDSLGGGRAALSQWPCAADRAEPGGNRRARHRAGHQATGLQLEDRNRPGHRGIRARDHDFHAGHDLRHRCRDP